MKPTQLTEVPVKVKTARAPADRLNAAVWSLQSRLRLPWNQSRGRPGSVVPGV
jgi:hypothetical protein